MHKIKQIPEDFIVKEIIDINKVITDNGKYSYSILKKRDYTTMKAIEHIANRLKIPLKMIGFCGNKDKRALTEQYISLPTNINPAKGLELKDLNLTFVGSGNNPLSLGDHKENEFMITIRNLNKKDIDKIRKIAGKKIVLPNYFGKQRFSKNNFLIGKMIITKKFEKAFNLILSNESEIGSKAREYAKANPSDFIGAIRTIPIKLRRMYMNAYQSHIFNKAIEKYLKKNKNKENIKIPVVGFGTEFNNKEIEKIIMGILKEENINFRDFIIPQIPELSSEGEERDLYMEVKDFKVVEQNEDELNRNKLKIKIGFKLNKGCYATVVIKELFDTSKQ